MYFPTQFYLDCYMTMKLLIMNINFVGEIDGFTNYNFESGTLQACYMKHYSSHMCIHTVCKA